LDLHVSSNADPGAVAAGIVRALVEEGQAVLKAGGGAALFVAMSAVVRARQQLKAEHAMDVLMVPQVCGRRCDVLRAAHSSALCTCLVRCLSNLVSTGVACAPGLMQWVTEDTRAALGRESKFLQFNLLPAGLHGVMEGLAHALRQPAVVPVPAPELCPASP
jgi:stage V sporulation protein SpoVS